MVIHRTHIWEIKQPSKADVLWYPTETFILGLYFEAICNHSRGPNFFFWQYLITIVMILKYLKNILDTQYMENIVQKMLRGISQLKERFPGHLALLQNWFKQIVFFSSVVVKGIRIWNNKDKLRKTNHDWFLTFHNP